MGAVASNGIWPPQTERITLVPATSGLIDTGDKEAATKTITANAEAVGTVNADYSHSVTYAAASDVRIQVLRMGALCKTTIDTLSIGNLRLRAYVDVQDAAHMMFDITYTTAGVKSDVADYHSGSLPTVLATLKDGAAHTIYWFLWRTDGGATVVVSLIQVQFGCGTCTNAATLIATVSHTGFISLSAIIRRTAGNVSVVWYGSAGISAEVKGIWPSAASPVYAFSASVMLSSSIINIVVTGASATELSYLDSIYAILHTGAG